MKEILIAAVTAVLTACFTNFVQHYFSEKSEKRKAALSLLNDYYSLLFNCYTCFLDDRSSANKARLLASIEKARIVAPDTTEYLLDEFEQKILHNVPNPDLAKSITALREVFRKDIQNVLQLQKQRK